MISVTVPKRKDTFTMGIIYCLNNLIDNRAYIGSTIKPKERVWTHKSLLKCDKHVNKKLQSDFNKVGESNFEVTVLYLEQMKYGGRWLKRDLREMEKVIIAELNPYYNVVYKTGLSDEQILQEVKR